MSTISEQGDDLALQKRIRQAVYDIRYKASKEEIDLRHAYSVYIGKSGLDQNGKEAVQNKLFGKQKEDAAESAVLESAEDNKYKVVHTNKETGKTYIRFAKRSRINKLRKKGSVEITGHGVPKGSKTSSTSAVKKSGGRQSLANLASNQRTLKKYKPTKITSRSKPIKPKDKPKTVIKTVEVEKKPEKKSPTLTDKVRKMIKKEPPKKVNEAVGAALGALAGGAVAAAGGVVAGGVKAAGSIAAAGQDAAGKNRAAAIRNKARTNVAKKQAQDIERAGGVSEDYLTDAAAVAPIKNKKIGGEKVDNSKLIKVFPQDQSDPQTGTIKSSYKPVGEVVAEILAKEAATPESGTGKYYKEGQPTAQQKRNAAARAEIRNLTNQGKHKEASALHAKITNTQREEFVDPFYKSVPEEGDDGTGRSMYTKWNNVKNRLRSMGLKCNYELEGNELIEDAVEYFYEQGITEDTIDAIVEEVGLDDFVEFVLDPHQDLVEERKARKAKANAPSFEKVKAAVDAADAAKRESGKGEYSKSYAKRSGETEDSTNYDDKPAKPKAKKVKQVVASPAKKAATKKKVTVAVKKVKPTAPEKTPTKKDGIKDGLRSKITKFVKKGVERHQKARAAGRVPEKRAKEFGKGVVSGVKTAVKVAKDVKKVVTGEEVVHEQGIEDILARLEKKRISKGGNPDDSPLGKPVGRAMKAKQDEVRKKAGVKEHHEKDADGNVIPHKTAPLTEGALVRQLLEGKA